MTNFLTSTTKATTSSTSTAAPNSIPQAVLSTGSDRSTTSAIINSVADQLRLLDELGGLEDSEETTTSFYSSSYDDDGEDDEEEQQQEEDPTPDCGGMSSIVNEELEQEPKQANGDGVLTTAEQPNRHHYEDNNLLTQSSPKDVNTDQIFGTNATPSAGNMQSSLDAISLTTRINVVVQNNEPQESSVLDHGDTEDHEDHDRDNKRMMKTGLLPNNNNTTTSLLPNGRRSIQTKNLGNKKASVRHLFHLDTKLKNTHKENESNLSSFSLDDDEDDDNDDITSQSNPTQDKLSSKRKMKLIQMGIIQKEERHVKIARIFLSCTIIIAALVISCLVYFIIRQDDEVIFHTQYNNYAHELTLAISSKVKMNFVLMKQMSASITSSAHQMGVIFPNLTVPQFEIYADYVSMMGSILSVGYAPLITSSERMAWEEYTQTHIGWLKESARLEGIYGAHQEWNMSNQQDNKFSKQIYHWGNDGVLPVPEKMESGKLYTPFWQMSPVNGSMINYNVLSDNHIHGLYQAMMNTNQSVLSSAIPIYNTTFKYLVDPNVDQKNNSPYAYLITPVHEEFATKPDIVGILVGVTKFGSLLENVLPAKALGIVCVFEDSCGKSITFELNGANATFMGYGDLHDTGYDEYQRSIVNLEQYKTFGAGICSHDVHIYPSSKLEESFESSRPVIYALIVAAVFFVTLLLVYVYDRSVTVRQNKTMKRAILTQQIVTSLFPVEVGKQMIEEANRSSKKLLNEVPVSTNSKDIVQNTANTDSCSQPSRSGKPLADLFPEATIMFCDLVGFTAWSSIRDPTQVFTLLETIYGAFDEIAKRRKVFKVETVGDCYVAVCGLPDPNKDHAVVMARFARECLSQMNILLPKLEVELGPDTSDLGMRFGLHSGQVTAGVLRGDRARFQLFGDTVNTTARIETTGAKNRIHLSQEITDRLVTAGKSHWVQKRPDKVVAKGKGELQTYWLELKGDLGRSSQHSVHSCDGNTIITKTEAAVTSPLNDDGEKTDVVEPLLSEKELRIVNWTTDVLLRVLREIVAHRRDSGVVADSVGIMSSAEYQIPTIGTIVLEEVKDAIALSPCNTMSTKCRQTAQSISISDEVQSQLHNYVQTIAVMYRKVPFHNFEHASHVTMSVVKLWSRIVAPNHDQVSSGSSDGFTSADHTFGITADPLTQFSVVFSALIHDVDHQGVPNTQLVKEGAGVAVAYKNRSIAEQNSLDVAWQLLMQDSYADLRRTIYATTDELRRFRQLVVNTVMATDVMDKGLNLHRRARWNMVFSTDEPCGSWDEVNRKATLVAEHLIQASDVAHTMQHWHVFSKWNARLFEEMYRAYQEGRADQDPALNWYENELDFFDSFVIPLAIKLRSCGVFGVSGEEYLTYAQQNRREWVSRGREVVAEMVESVHLLSGG